MDRIARGICPKCGKRPKGETTIHCLECSEKRNTATRLAMKALKDDVYAKYGGYVCACCGETEEVFLTIDHVNNDGCIHRKQVGMTDKLYRWLKKNNYPLGFQILCRNCQEGKFRYGTCPHQLVRSENGAVFDLKKCEQVLQAAKPYLG